MPVHPCGDAGENALRAEAGAEVPTAMPPSKISQSKFLIGFNIIKINIATENPPILST